MSPFRRFHTLGLFAAGAALAACAPGQSGLSPVSQLYYDYSFVANEVGYAAQFGPVPVYVRGGPFANERDARAIVDVMNTNRYVGDLVFTPATAPSPRGYSIVLAYGPLVPGFNYCAAPADFAVGTPTQGLQITGAFCTTGRLRSVGMVTGPASSDVRSPEVRTAIDQLTTAILSPDLDPNRKRMRTGEQ
jgi:hypothetical protein